MNNIFHTQLASDTKVLTARKEASFLGKCVGYDNPILNVILKIASFVFKNIGDELDFQRSLRQSIDVNRVWSLECINQSDAMKHLMALGIMDFVKLPILDIGNREGKTGYIDFVKPEEMTAPIMRGIDCRRRPVLYIRYEATQAINAYYPKGSRHVTAYFPLRRGGYEENIWVAGSSGIQLTYSILSYQGDKIRPDYEILNNFLTLKSNNDFKLV